MEYVSFGELRILEEHDVRSVPEISDLITELFRNGQPSKAKEVMDSLFRQQMAPMIMEVIRGLIMTEDGHKVILRLRSMYDNGTEAWLGTHRVSKPAPFDDDDDRGEYTFLY